MDRKCKICGGVDKLVDVYQLSEIKAYGEHSQKKAQLPIPDVYCNTHFMSLVWNKPKE